MKYLIVLLVILNIQTGRSNDSLYTEITRKFEHKELSVANIKSALCELQINYQDEVLTRILIESGNLKSKLTIKGNNLFGMRKSGKRKNTALKSTLYGYATYKHWIYSIIDYKLWEMSSKPKRHETYKQFLKRRHWNS
jgi:uncharacterized FlgJ-related protein